MQNRLRFNWSVVTNGHGPVGFARADGFGGLGDSRCSADTLIGNAGVGAFETVADSNVAEDIVRQVPKQPHGIDRAVELAPESLEVAARGRHEREKVIVTSISAPA